ncbi:unnamed protein product [Chondrus crispus]|uniref:Uncharacterized protein n=1 Tax=Chondrus crispus TaxID=2769 RepID=R7QMZ6_CHOCR|nr:unnamed protein product [Chondrus crispus]CDF38856.1 unnamed protein product [Chondrus crispus]|eukprot:XP_005718761.1 unnamed protein product [Chondrus crispus]
MHFSPPAVSVNTISVRVITASPNLLAFLPIDEPLPTRALQVGHYSQASRSKPKMSQKRLAGLASAFEGPSSKAPQAPSTVSSIASRFDASPASDSKEPKVSEKVSGIASQFGTTIADADASVRKKKISPKPAAKQPQKPDSVTDERPSFGEITKRFASGKAGLGTTAQSDQSPNMFAAAANAWGKREAEGKPKAEGKVTAFKREIENAKKSANKEREAVKQQAQVPSDKVVEEKAGGVGSIASRFESGAQEKAKQDEREPLVDRFQSATKIFAGEEKSEKEGADAEAVNSKFADAAKLFGGGSA